MYYVVNYILNTNNMGPPGAVDREFVYRDFVYSSSFFLLPSFVLVLPSLFLHLLCCFFLLSSCFFCVASSFSLPASFVLLLLPSWPILIHLGRMLDHPGSILAPQSHLRISISSRISLFSSLGIEILEEIPILGPQSKLEKTTSQKPCKVLQNGNMTSQKC